ncbi:MAG TPA: cell division ATP-binding protein FtsE [Candidatus Limnocylindrales bacterium]|nr:cell division ATP-binding protein FtsE [Candidatus Limnocylindrales bacterium]
MSMIQMYNVYKVYEGGVRALEDITLSIEKGEFVFLTGPSGAGKTTLLKIIFREELPTSGNVLVNNFNIARLQRSSVPYLRRNIGVVFQDFKLLKKKTVFENVAFALKVIGAPRREIDQRVLQILRLLDLKDKMDMLPHLLSGGEQQRVAIARALVNHPTIVLADEPTGNLDQELSLEIMSLFEDINARGTTVVVATHNRMIIREMRKKVFCLDKGRLVRIVDNGKDL